MVADPIIIPRRIAVKRRLRKHPSTDASASFPVILRALSRYPRAPFQPSPRNFPVIPAQLSSHPRESGDLITRRHYKIPAFETVKVLSVNFFVVNAVLFLFHFV
jgi:hypothetical protein